MNDPSQDIKDVIEELKRRSKSKEIPDRQLVRVALLALGRVKESDGEPEAALLSSEILEAAEPHEERWTEALESELALAVAEHVASVDPKFLEMPIYDFKYTVAARERLELRLQAMELLRSTVPESLLEQIASADERLLPYLERE
ncbi:MAG: hypothetical protein ACI8X5_003300 [Planctomycetota bacterium]|jgi:hypothetical protein